ncbi:hypothetical protein PR048_016920 [Dryococelus australis]|uniref:Uncharacterized protein n=1 Tax=Dryococelus australis TaxID=614101 RepID=A0ABQ9H8A3_9NEOP|nr:hypothetical protein PR048_016920 [Dryococelus australis]
MSETFAEGTRGAALHHCKLDDSECWRNYLDSSLERKLKKGQIGVPCKLDDSDCLKNFYQNEIIGKFTEGFPEIGVKSIDPLHYDQLSMVYEVGIGTKFTLTHTDPILYGLAKTKIENVRTVVSGSKFTMDAQVTIPKIFYEGSYTCEGEWFMWPFSWKGNFNISLGEVSDTWKMSADVVDRGDESYLHLTDISFSPKVTSYHAYATGLFGNEEVGKQIEQRRCADDDDEEEEEEGVFPRPDVRGISSHQGEPGSILGQVTSGFSQLGIVPDDAAGQRVFSRISRLTRPCIPALLHFRLISPSSALKRSMLSADRICQLTPVWGWSNANPDHRADTVRGAPVLPTWTHSFADRLYEATGTGFVSEWLLHAAKRFGIGWAGSWRIGKFALEMTNKYWQNFFDVMWRLVKPHVVSVAADEIKAIFAKMPITGMTSE